MKTPAKPRPRKDAIIGIRTTQEVKDAAEEAALAERRSISQWVEGLILDAISERQKRRESLRAPDRARSRGQP